MRSRSWWLVGLALALLVAAAEGQAGPGPTAPRRIIEAEQLIASAKTTSAELLYQDMASFGPDWGDNAQLFWPNNYPGTRLTLTPTLLLPGRYDIYVVFTRAPDYGTIEVRFNGGAPHRFDGHAPSVRPEKLLVASGDLKAGSHRLTVDVIGTALPRGQYYVGIDRIVFEPARRGLPVGLD